MAFCPRIHSRFVGRDGTLRDANRSVVVSRTVEEHAVRVQRRAHAIVEFILDVDLERVGAVDIEDWRWPGVGQRSAAYGGVSTQGEKLSSCSPACLLTRYH